jgi:Flp pilus assembly protein TadB
MFDMFMQSVGLFLRGKLFQNPAHVARQAAIGVLLTAIVCVALVKVVGVLWLAVLVSALVGGVLQPFLFKNLKYN